LVGHAVIVVRAYYLIASSELLREPAKIDPRLSQLLQLFRKVTPVDEDPTPAQPKSSEVRYMPAVLAKTAGRNGSGDIQHHSACNF